MVDINYQTNTGNPSDRGSAFYDSEMPIVDEPDTLVGVR
jgi:hypothetical protein